MSDDGMRGGKVLGFWPALLIIVILSGLAGVTGERPPRALRRAS
jgi:hypothetical protein